MKIYKSCTAGLSDEDFREYHTSGLSTFISYERLMRESIKQNLRVTERIVGMLMNEDGITLFLETK